VKKPDVIQKNELYFCNQGSNVIQNQLSKSKLIKKFCFAGLCNRQHAYHYTRVQNLLPEGLLLRVQFCEWLLQQHEANPNFVKIILFTDECLFSRNGTFNIHNYHVWVDENPHAIHVNAFQHRLSINL
jgi:hypothetical protein